MRVNARRALRRRRREVLQHAERLGREVVAVVPGVAAEEDRLPRASHMDLAGLRIVQGQDAAQHAVQLVGREDSPETVRVAEAAARRHAEDKLVDLFG